MELIIQKIKEFVNYEITRRIKRGVSRVKTFIRFARIGMKWHDYDYQPTLHQFLDNLDLIADHIIYHNIHSNCGKDYKQIKEATRLITKAMDDNYYEDIYEKPIVAKYGRKVSYTPSDRTKELFRWVSIREEENHTNAATIRKLERKAYAKARKDVERDWNKGWDILVENIRSWWC